MDLSQCDELLSRLEEEDPNYMLVDWPRPVFVEDYKQLSEGTWLGTQLMDFYMYHVYQNLTPASASGQRHVPIPLATVSGQHDLRAPLANAACQYHLPAPLANTTCQYHLPAPLENTICQSHLPAPLVNTAGQHHWEQRQCVVPLTKPPGQ